VRTDSGLLPRVKDSTREYVGEADKLQKFLDHHCEVGEGFLTLQLEFATLYREFSSERFSNEDWRGGWKRRGSRGLRTTSRRDSSTIER
jgi:hypothetical protein